MQKNDDDLNEMEKYKRYCTKLDNIMFYTFLALCIIALFASIRMAYILKFST